MFKYLAVNCVVPENIHTTPTEGIGFSSWGGGAICPISQWGGGVHHREIFPGVLVTCERASNKEKHKKLPHQINL